MTYQEYFEKCSVNFKIATQKYLEAENEIFKNGFQDINLLQKYARAKAEFEIISNSYYAYIDFVTKYNINPNDEMTS